MTQPLHTAGDGLPAGPAPQTTAGGRRAAGGTGRGVPLSIWPGLSAPAGTQDGGPLTVTAARQIIGAFSVPGDLIAAAGCTAAASQAAAAAGRRILHPWAPRLRLRTGAALVHAGQEQLVVTNPGQARADHDGRPGVAGQHGAVLTGLAPARALQFQGGSAGHGARG